MKFNTDKCDILHWGSKNGVSKYRVEREVALVGTGLLGK